MEKEIVGKVMNRKGFLKEPAPQSANIGTIPGSVTVNADIVAIDRHHRIPAEGTIRSVPLGDHQRQLKVIHRINFFIGSHILNPFLNRDRFYLSRMFKGNTADWPKTKTDVRDGRGNQGFSVLETMPFLACISG